MGHLDQKQSGQWLPRTCQYADTKCVPPQFFYGLFLAILPHTEDFFMIELAVAQEDTVHEILKH
jgi:hypothetical protein